MHVKSLRTTVLQAKETRHHWLSRQDRNSQRETVLKIEGTRLDGTLTAGVSQSLLPGTW